MWPQLVKEFQAHCQENGFAVEGFGAEYAFAEWAVQLKEVFGDCTKLDESEMEGAYDEAMGQFRMWTKREGQ